MSLPRPRLEDLEAIRHRYAAERDKRIREDGNDQYVEIAGDLARYVDDPYVEPGFQRDPVDKTVDALIIGGGFGGWLDDIFGGGISVFVLAGCPIAARRWSGGLDKH